MTAAGRAAVRAVPAEVLYGVARRLDARREFLLVSRVLGKHIPVAAAIPLAAGAALALQLDPGRLAQVDLADALTDPRAARTLWEQVRSRPAGGLGAVTV
ncbi:MAG TPA: phosphoribosyltransferase domain-containing protein, partial [Candidatus Dormibacteraeota bacterium]|nr:phosphoribosyltransferase domain-containing protein [Candidatus Dormibacteraeota bacterium]